MTLLRTAIRVLLVVAAAAGFADRLGRPSPLERSPHAKASSALSTPARSFSR
jgi:hypothetical protein